MEKEFKCSKCGYESDDAIDFLKYSQSNTSYFCNDCEPYKEFNLKKVRLELFDKCVPNFVIHGNEPMLLIIKSEIEEQDKEFIKKLKEKAMSGVNAWSYTKEQKGKSLPCFINIDDLDKLAGDFK